MSQQKVDKYKQDKANRAQIMKKQKFTRRLQVTLVIAIVAAALVWFGVSVYNSNQAAEETGSVYIDSEEVVSYMNDPVNWSPEDGETTEETTEDTTEETTEDTSEETTEESSSEEVTEEAAEEE